MAKIFWVEDQSHWIDKFQETLERADVAASVRRTSLRK